MAQMLSTFSHVEQSRFEAFQRSRFSPAVVEEWVGAVLSQRYGLDENRALSDLVLPNQASDIVMVVGVLAKIYAQRLVWEAIRIRQESAADEDTADNNRGSINTPLQAEYVMEAWRQRRQEGQDPGFFLQPHDTSFRDGDDDVHDARRLAALAAQEEYEKEFPETKETDSTTGESQDAMEVDGGAAGDSTADGGAVEVNTGD